MAYSRLRENTSIPMVRTDTSSSFKSRESLERAREPSISTTPRLTPELSTPISQRKLFPFPLGS